MKRLNQEELNLCRIQARIFEASLKETMSSPIFIRRFMNSEVAKRMDQGGFFLEASSMDSIFCELEEEYGKSNYGKIKYAEDELYWIGYMYRYWAVAAGWSSKKIYRIIGAKDMKLRYYPLHTMDPERAIEEIMEDKEISMNSEERNLEIMRRLILEKMNKKKVGI